jgi:hypothetical protein
MTDAIDEVHITPGGLTLAVASLDAACRDLDDAVLVMSDVAGDDVMASPSLVALLHRVVLARRRVRRLAVEAAEVGSRLRASAAS